MYFRRRECCCIFFRCAKKVALKVSVVLFILIVITIVITIVYNSTVSPSPSPSPQMGVYNSTRTVSPSPSLSPQMGVYNSTVSPSQKAQEYELEALAWIFMLEIIVTFLYPLVTSMSLLICMNNFVTFLVWMYLDEEEDDIHKHEAVFLDLIASTAWLVSGIVFSLPNKGESE